MSPELSAIEERNRRVEADKAWETSWTRRLIIAVGTYVTVAVYLSAIRIENALFHAAVPTGAYLISTVTLPAAKKLWLAHLYRPRR